MMSSSMKMLPAALLLVLSVLSHAEPSPTTRRAGALAAIKACLGRNEASSRECKNLNQNVNTLVDVYRAGDKTVLPLFRFTCLTDFYDESLLSDPEGFLIGMAKLPEESQEAVATGIAGGSFGLAERVRQTLLSISQSPAIHETAETALTELEKDNAVFFVDYFPPRTFLSRAANLQTRRYSREMYSLHEPPLWPTESNGQRTTYRLTLLATHRSRMVSLTVLPDGNGRLVINDDLEAEHATAVDKARVSEFLKKLELADYWNMPAETQQRGFDGADCMLEAAQDGRYDVVVRWCPDGYNRSLQEAYFTQAARFLLELADYKQRGGCG
jgi:hypothetical protein